MASASQWQQVKCGEKQASAFEDDDQSTTVPSDVLQGTASYVSTWDAGNLMDLGSCGVLSAAEMRAARLQQMGMGQAQQSAKAKAVPKRGKASGKGQQQPQPQTAAPQLAHPTFQALARRMVTDDRKGQVDDEDQSTIAPSDLLDESVDLEDLDSCQGLTSSELRAARLQSIAKPSGKGQHLAKPTPVASQVARPKSSNVPPALQKPKPVTKEQTRAGTQLNAELNKTSREAIRDMGLWEYMPARNPVVTRNTCKGADFNIGFEEYQHTLGGVADAKPAERSQHADELHRHLDAQSREIVKEMGLWQHMPAKNPVVTQQTVKGAAWHVGFDQYEHSLGGEPDSKPIERPHEADDLKRHFDIQSRGAIKEMGLWEHMPAKNPVVTRQSNKGAEWHMAFGEYVHTLGGVPDSQPVARPHHADVMSRHLDKASREDMKKMGACMAFR